MGVERPLLRCVASLVTRSTIAGSRVPTIYYVDATSGSDSNDGLSPATAWQTQNQVRTSTFNIGDVVKFKRGEVFVEPTATLDFQAGVIYAAYDAGARPVLEGLTRVTGWTLQSGSVYQVTYTRAGHANEMLFENGVEGTRQTSLGAVTSPRDFYLDDAGNTLYYWASDNADPDTHTIHFAHGSNGLFRHRFVGNGGVMKDLDIRFGNATNQLMRGEVGVVQTKWTFQNCVFRNARHHAFLQTNASGSKMDFFDCEFLDNGLGGLVLSTGVGNCTIAGCIASGNDFDITNGNGIFVLGTGTFITNCTGFDNANAGVAIFGGSTDVVVEDSECYNNGINHPDSTGFSTDGLRTIFRRCVSYDNGTQTDEALGRGFNTDLNSDGTRFEYCIAYGNQHDGFGLASGTPTLGHKMLNCVSVNNGVPGSSAPLGTGIVTFGLTNTLDNLEIRNCIFANNHRDTGDSYAIYDNIGNISGAAGVTLDNNLYYDDTAHTNIINWGGKLYATLAAFNTAQTPFEDNGIESDPLFVNEGANNYRLTTPTSPAIDEGVDVGLTSDFEGNLVPNPDTSIVDMGAFES